MRLPILLAAALVAAPALPFQAAAVDDPIVVTAHPLAETQKQLADCIARKCSPDQDIAATLAHAENQFLAGQYKKSRTTLLKSIDRNKDVAKPFPVPLSDLYRANGRVAEHVGEARSYQSSILAMRDTLRNGLGAGSPRTLAAQIEVGDSRAKLGFPDEADHIYADVAASAAAQGLNRLVVYARLRQAVLAQMSAEDTNLPSEKKRARMAFEDIIAKPLQGTDDLQLVARVSLARLDRKAGRQDTTANLLHYFAQQGGADRPMLLSSEPIERVNADAMANAATQALWQSTAVSKELGAIASLETSKRLAALNSIGKWVDIGFWVTPSGSVADVEILREQGGLQWTRPVIQHLKRRIYAPLKASQDGVNPGFYLIERYSLTSRWMDDNTGTNLRRREFTPRIERLDITPDNYQRPVVASNSPASNPAK